MALGRSSNRMNTICRQVFMAQVLLLLLVAVTNTDAFQASTVSSSSQQTKQQQPAAAMMMKRHHVSSNNNKLKFRTSTVLEGATGGWGIGNSREMVPEEFAKGDRKAFEGYELTERGDFMRQIREDNERMQKDELNELLGVAKIAGIKVKDPSQRLNKFEPDILQEEEDDLDLSV